MVVCWGDKVWNALPNNWSNNGEAKQGASISCGGRSFDRHLVYPFQHKEITLIGVHHPCVGYDRAYHDQVFATLGILKTSLSH